MENLPLPKIIGKYLSRIIKEYCHATKKHPTFARFWNNRMRSESYVHSWMKDTQRKNDMREEADTQTVWDIFQEEDLEVIDAVQDGDTKNARTELIQGIVVRLRALEKLDKEGC